MTSGWGVHDDRWMAALREIGRAPTAISLGRDVPDLIDLRTRVQEAAADGRPVLAGPLVPITRSLADLPIRLIGLSWGYDLAQLAGDTAGDASAGAWLAGLAGVIVDSAPNAAVALRCGVEPSRVTLLPWGVDLTEFAFHGPWVDAFPLGVPPHAPLVLSLRAHEPLYRVADIIDAFARLERPDGLHEDHPDPYLIIGHSGSLTDALRDRADDLGIAARVRFIGTVPEKDLPPLLGRAACYVTAAQTDGTSVTLLQALACGTPVIATRTPGNLDWIEEGITGFTYPVGDVAALAAAIDAVVHRYPIEVSLRGRRLVEARADWTANLPRLRDALAGG